MHGKNLSLQTRSKHTKFSFHSGNLWVRLFISSLCQTRW